MPPRGELISRLGVNQAPDHDETADPRTRARAQQHGILGGLDGVEIDDSGSDKVLVAPPADRSAARAWR